MIYTSYFANRNIPSDALKLSIARYSDKINIPKYDKLAPDGKLMYLFKNKIYNQYQFTKAFNSQLLKLNVDTVIDELETMANGRDIYLLCYETPDKFCHRHLVSKWLNSNIIRCQEFGEPELTNKEWLTRFGIQDNKIKDYYCAKK